MANNYGCYSPPGYYPQPVYQPNGCNPPAAAPSKPLINGYECFDPGSNLELLKSGVRTFGDNGAVLLEPRTDGKVNILKRGSNGCFEFYDVGMLYDDGYVAIKRDTAPPKNTPSEAPDEQFDPGQNLGLLKSGIRTFGDNETVLLEPRVDGKINVLKRGANGCFQQYGVGMLYDDGYVRIKGQTQPPKIGAGGDAVKQNTEHAQGYQGALGSPRGNAQDKKFEPNRTAENKPAREETPDDFDWKQRETEMRAELEANKIARYRINRRYSEPEQGKYVSAYDGIKDSRTEVRITDGGSKEITVHNPNHSSYGKTKCIFTVDSSGKPSTGRFTVSFNGEVIDEYDVKVARDKRDPDFYRFTDPHATERLKRETEGKISEVRVKVHDVENHYLGYTQTDSRDKGGVYANGEEEIPSDLPYNRAEQSPEESPKPKEESSAPPHGEPKADPGESYEVNGSANERLHNETATHESKPIENSNDLPVRTKSASSSDVSKPSADSGTPTDFAVHHDKSEPTAAVPSPAKQAEDIKEIQFVVERRTYHRTPFNNSPQITEVQRTAPLKLDEIRTVLTGGAGDVEGGKQSEKLLREFARHYSRVDNDGFPLRRQPKDQDNILSFPNNQVSKEVQGERIFNGIAKEYLTLGKDKNGNPTVTAGYHEINDRLGAYPGMRNLPNQTTKAGFPDPYGNGTRNRDLYHTYTLVPVSAPPKVLITAPVREARQPLGGTITKQPDKTEPEKFQTAPKRKRPDPKKIEKPLKKILSRPEV